jgi:hypothetical protein
MELAGRYFGTGFDSAPIMIMMPVEPEQEMSTKPFETMGGVTSPRVPSPLKAYEYMAARRPPGKFSTAPKQKR